MPEHTTKTRIKEAAVKLFAEKGVAETTTRDLALAAEIAEGTIYRHYRSKEELVRELFREHFAAFADRIQSAVERADNIRGRLDLIIEESCAVFDDDPTLYRFLLLIQHEALPRLAKTSRNPLVALGKIVEEGISAGEVKVRNSQLAAAMVMGLLIQPALAITHGNLKPPMRNYAGEISAAAVRVLCH
jgi:AcrR family transcriptional regulator